MHQQAASVLGDIFTQVKEMQQPSFSLCSGIAGVGWLVDHLCRQGFVQVSADEVLSDIDEYVFQAALRKLNQSHYDFMHGAMGMVFYLIKRNRWDYLHHLTQALANITIWEKECAKWQSVLRNGEDTIGFNISLSHGSSSLALVLCKILQIMPENETAERLLKGAVEYILNQEISVAQYGCYFPAFSLESQQDITKTRLAWCYGDLGVGLAILQSGTRLHNQVWVDKGMEVLLHAASRRGLVENMVKDAGICHGTAGVAHIFNRLYRNTQRVEFIDAANYWCLEMLKMAQFKDGLAGYKTFVGGGWLAKDSLLEGIAGIGLSLLSFVMPEDPAWDECLLLS